MLDAAVVAALTEPQLAEYKRAAVYVTVVTICEPDDLDRRFDQAAELLRNAGIATITVPDIQAYIDSGTSDTMTKAVACGLMDNIESGFK